MTPHHHTRRLHPLVHGSKGYYSYDCRGESVSVYLPESTACAGSAASAASAAWGACPTDALGNSLTNVYDALNRVTTNAFPDGTKQLIAYDALGRKVSQTDQAANTTLFGYDGLGRLTSVTNALSQVTRYGYDEAGNQTNQVDALNRATTFEYDALGRRTKRTLPGGQAETFGYDKAGNLLSHTDFNGLVITNQYDLLNRLSKRWKGGTQLEGYSYDLAGQLTNRTDASGTFKWVYDLRGRVITNTTPVGTLTYRYDANGNLTNLYSATSGGVSNVYQYDALNRLTNVIDNALSGTKNTGYSYDGVGNLQTLKYPNGATNFYQYDSLNRLTNLLWRTAGTTNASFYYQLGPTGNRTNVAEVVNAASRGFAWGYDPLFRLTNETASGSSPTGTLGYSYDKVGNRTNRTGTLGSVVGTTNTFDVNDWLDNDTTTNNGSAYFDANGNTRTNGTVSYGYDYANRMIAATNGAAVVTMVYDADGNRVKKVAGGTTNYLIAMVNPTGYPQVVEEYNGATLARGYTYGLQLISQRLPSSSTNYFISDGHGSTRMLTDNAGNVANAFAYDAFGTLIASNTTAQTTYLYSGEQFDPDLGFYYLRARYLNPGNGRFLTMDTYEGKQEDSLSIHKYLYCKGNPVNMVDPKGRDGALVSFIVTLGAVEILSAGSFGVINAVGTKYAGYYISPESLTKEPFKTWIANSASEAGIQPRFLAAILANEHEDLDWKDIYGDVPGDLLGGNHSIGMGQIRPDTVASILHHSRLHSSIALLDRKTNIKVTALYIKALVDMAKELDQNNPSLSFIFDSPNEITLGQHNTPMSQWDQSHLELLSQQYTQTPWQFYSGGNNKTRAYISSQAIGYHDAFWKNYNRDEYKAASP